MAIDVEQAFDDFVRSYGGVVVKETISGDPTFNNADYVFHEHRVVAELKCLQENKLEDPMLMGKMEAAWNRWEKEGLVVGEIPDLIVGSQIPHQCFQELRSICSAQYKGLIKKANKQVRETKRELKLPSYKGLLLLCNDGNFALPPPTMMNFVSKILCHDYSEINDFVLFTANMVAKVPDVEVPCFLWMAGSIRGEDGIGHEFLLDLREKWNLFHGKLLGTSGRKFGTDEVKLLPV